MAYDMTEAFVALQREAFDNGVSPKELAEKMLRIAARMGIGGGLTEERFGAAARQAYAFARDVAAREVLVKG